MNKRVLFIYLAVIFLFIVISLNLEPTGKITDSELIKREIKIIRVIDGDTIESNIGNVRLLGVNSPEKNKYFYEESKNYLKKFENKSVILIFDKEIQDKYDRYLGYLEYENSLINLNLLEQGYASLYMEEGLYYEKKLIRAENSARKNNFGIWKKSGDKCSKCIGLYSIDPQNEFFILKNNCDFNCELSSWTVKDSGRNEIKLEPIESKQLKEFKSKSNIWNNDHDKFFLRDSEGLLVLYHEY